MKSDLANFYSLTLPISNLNLLLQANFHIEICIKGLYSILDSHNLQLFFNHLNLKILNFIHNL